MILFSTEAIVYAHVYLTILYFRKGKRSVGETNGISEKIPHPLFLIKIFNFF